NCFLHLGSFLQISSLRGDSKQTGRSSGKERGPAACRATEVPHKKERPAFAERSTRDLKNELVLLLLRFGLRGRRRSRGAGRAGGRRLGHGRGRGAGGGGVGHGRRRGGGGVGRRRGGRRGRISGRRRRHCRVSRGGVGVRVLFLLAADREHGDRENRDQGDGQRLLHCKILLHFSDRKI